MWTKAPGLHLPGIPALALGAPWRRLVGRHRRDRWDLSGSISERGKPRQLRAAAAWESSASEPRRVSGDTIRSVLYFSAALLQVWRARRGCLSPGSGTPVAPLGRRAAVLGTQAAGSTETTLQVWTAGGRRSPRALALAQQPGTGARWLGRLWPWGDSTPGISACLLAGLRYP